MFSTYIECVFLYSLNVFAYRKGERMLYNTMVRVNIYYSRGGFYMRLASTQSNHGSALMPLLLKVSVLLQSYYTLMRHIVFR